MASDPDVIAKLTRQVATLSTQLELMRQRLDENASTASSRPTGASNNRPRLKLDVPRFNGTDTHGWIFQITQFFTYHETPEEERISIASFYLDGSALAWYQWMYRNHQITSWAEFLCKLEIRFPSVHGAAYSLPSARTGVSDWQFDSHSVSDSAFDSPTSEETSSVVADASSSCQPLVTEIPQAIDVVMQPSALGDDEPELTESDLASSEQRRPTTTTSKKLVTFSDLFIATALSPSLTIAAIPWLEPLEHASSLVVTAEDDAISLPLLGAPTQSLIHTYPYDPGPINSPLPTNPSDGISLFNWWYTSDLPWLILEWVGSQCRCPSHARLNNPTKSPLPKQPDWNLNEVEHPPPPPEPPELYCIRFYPTQIYHPCHVLSYMGILETLYACHCDLLFKRVGEHCTISCCWSILAQHHGFFLLPNNTCFAFQFLTIFDVSLFLMVFIHLSPYKVVEIIIRSLLVRNPNMIVFGLTGTAKFGGETGVGWVTNTVGQKVRVKDLLNLQNMVLIRINWPPIWKVFSHSMDTLWFCQALVVGMNINSVFTCMNLFRYLVHVAAGWFLFANNLMMCPSWLGAPRNIICKATHMLAGNNKILETREPCSSIIVDVMIQDLEPWTKNYPNLVFVTITDCEVSNEVNFFYHAIPLVFTIVAKLLFLFTQELGISHLAPLFLQVSTITYGVLVFKLRLEQVGITLAIENSSFLTTIWFESDRSTHFTWIIGGSNVFNLMSLFPPSIICVTLVNSLSDRVFLNYEGTNWNPSRVVCYISFCATIEALTCMLGSLVASQEWKPGNGDLVLLMNYIGDFVILRPSSDFKTPCSINTSVEHVFHTWILSAQSTPTSCSMLHRLGSSYFDPTTLFNRGLDDINATEPRTVKNAAEIFHNLKAAALAQQEYQWGQSGHGNASLAVGSFQFKQWDPGKKNHRENFYNLEDKVGFDGVDIDMNQGGVNSEEQPITDITTRPIRQRRPPARFQNHILFK